MSLRTCCLTVLGSVRYPVRQPLALDPPEGRSRAFPVLHLASVPFEIPFGQIAVQMGLANRVVCSEQGPLHEAETAFRGVDMQEAAHAHVFVGRMVHGAVA
jgi:hypothetical protein